MYFRGEIYNRKELGFAGDDAEVVAAAYAKWGVEAFAKLRGAFAIAITDGAKTILARDQFGSMPFYYSTQPFVYGNTVKDLLAHGVERKLSKIGLNTFLAYGYLVHPWTMIEGVMCVPPASYVIYDAADKSVKTVEYWRPSFVTREWDESELIDSISNAIFTSTKRQLEYGGNPSAFLSGGVDSSAIVAMMRRMGADYDVRTYCVTNEDPRYDERQWAKMVADQNRTHHTELLLTADEIRNNLDTAVASYDQPSMDGLNFWFGFKLVKERGEKVILSGEGGDELFLSEIYKALLACKCGKYMHHLPAFLGQLLEAFAPKEKYRKFAQLMGCKCNPYFIAYRIFSEKRIRSMVRPELLDFTGIRDMIDDSHGEIADLNNYVSWMDMRNADIDMYQRDGFQTAVAHGVTMRMPLMDVELAEILYSVSGARKYDLVAPKPYLWKPCGDAIPMACIKRPKKGFSLPFKDYFNGELKDKLDAFLMAGDTKLFKPEAIRELGRQFYAGKVYWSNIWIPFMAENWCRQNKIEL